MSYTLTVHLQGPVLTTRIQISVPGEKGSTVEGPLPESGRDLPARILDVPGLRPRPMFACGCVSGGGLRFLASFKLVPRRP